MRRFSFLLKSLEKMEERKGRVKEKTKDNIRAVAVGAAGGITLQERVAVPSTALEPEFVGIFAGAATAASLRSSARHCSSYHVKYGLHRKPFSLEHRLAWSGTCRQPEGQCDALRSICLIIRSWVSGTLELECLFLRGWSLYWPCRE